MTTKIANISVPTSFVKNPSIASPITASFTNNKNVSKIQKTALVNLLYVKDAIKVFFLDLYNSFFSWRIITKIPFFIFFYGFWTAFGAVDTIYYVALTIFVLKASKDLISSLSDRNILRKFSEYFPIKNRLDALKSILKGASFGPFLFALD
ncbi:hypothetical protein LCGC14_1913350, partial [marine sediment metagenome]